MGLLDDLLSSMAGGQGTPTRPASQVPPARQSGGDMSQVLMRLLPIVLAMIAQRGGGAPRTGNAPSPGGGLGGLGDLLGSLLGGSGGGLGDLLAQFQRAGLGAQAESWVNSGRNEPISPDAVERVFGHDALAQLARQAGISEADAARGLSQLLPEVVDRVTPDGRVPPQNELLASVEAFTRRSTQSRE
jgi:uncharacterized protein YidB (DUF937 family)